MTKRLQDLLSLASKEAPVERRPTVLVVDGLSVFVRHFVCHPATSVRHDACGGVVGFLGAVTSLVEQVRPERVVVVWEGGGSTKKRAIFPEYKARRRPQKLNRLLDDVPNTVDNRNWQLGVIVAALKNVAANQIYVEGCEGDDVIGYLCRYSFPGKDKIIMSSDRDYYQLLDSSTRIFSPGTRRFVTAEKVTEEFKITPRNFCTAKAICGDDSDNIPGIPGVGFKVVAKRFPTLGGDEEVSVEDVIEESTSLAVSGKLKVHKQIADGADLIRRNWRLMFLDTANLSASQIRKVEVAVSGFQPRQDKIGLLRTLVREGVTTVDADRMFTAFNLVRETDRT